MKNLFTLLLFVSLFSGTVQARPLCPACPPYPILKAAYCVGKAVLPKKYHVTITKKDGSVVSFDRWAESRATLKARLWVNARIGLHLRVYGHKDIKPIFIGDIHSINVVRVDGGGRVQPNTPPAVQPVQK